MSAPTPGPKVRDAALCSDCQAEMRNGKPGRIWLCPLHAAAPALLAQLKESMQWVAKLAADNDDDGNVIGLRALRQILKIEALIKEIEG